MMSGNCDLNLFKRLGTLWNIWVALAAFMGTQVFVALARLVSGTGPWKGLNILGRQNIIGGDVNRVGRLKKA